MDRYKGHLIIGGPLDGERAKYADSASGYGQPAGRFDSYRAEYIPYNSANRGRGIPSMIWLHKSLVAA